jgi:hypothetical protein
MPSRPPYEFWGVTREQVEKDYPQFLKSGWIGSAEQEAPLFRDACKECGIVSEPKHGWKNLAYEIRLIELTLPDGATDDTLGRAQLAEKCIKVSDQLWECYKTLGEFTWSNEFTMAQFESGLSLNKSFDNISDIRRTLGRLSTYLSATKNRPKWRQRVNRIRRLVLACKLAPLFELEFEQLAKPVGGSTVLQLSETNDWTRFFQAIASLVLSENVTPDRQAILWEAAQPITEQSDT